MPEPTGWVALPAWMLDDPTIEQHDLLVLLALNAWTNRSGECWPSIAQIASRARLSRSSTNRALDALREKGFVSWERRQRENGSWTSNFYRVNLNPPCATQTHPPSQGDTPRMGPTDTPRTNSSRTTPPTPHTGTDTTPERPGAAPHPHEPNTVRALAALAAEHGLGPLTHAPLLSLAYAAGLNGDPWDGYRRIRDEMARLGDARQPLAVLRHRLLIGASS